MSMPPDWLDQHIDLALRREPDAGPPPDFARSVAARVEQRREAKADVERWLLRALCAVFALSALVVAVTQGRDWLAGFGAMPLPGASGLGWAMALLACVGVSWSLDQLRPRRH